MYTTTDEDLAGTLTREGAATSRQCAELLSTYDAVLSLQRVSWTHHLRVMRRLGSGGQGVVYLSERRGADGFTLPVAVKVFSPARFATPAEYDEAMERIGGVSAKVARIQHDNLLVVQNFVDRQRIRLMVMEWIEGFDLRQLLAPTMLQRLKPRLNPRRWEYLSRVIATQGPVQPRFKAGMAVAIVRDCLEALAALHRNGILHGDIKPANIMLKRTGHAKIIDIGSAVDLADPPKQRACTPAYAALEVLEGGEVTPLSDLASLGYVLLELLAGQPLFPGVTKIAEMIDAKRSLEKRLPQILPNEVVVNDLLMSFCRGMIAPNPRQRFPSATAAEWVDDGAAAFHRQLVKGDLATEYENDIHIWIEELLQLEQYLFDPV